jgi:hypothetical protein
VSGRRAVVRGGRLRWTDLSLAGAVWVAADAPLEWSYLLTSGTDGAGLACSSCTRTRQALTGPAAGGLLVCPRCDAAPRARLRWWSPRVAEGRG